MPELISSNSRNSNVSEGDIEMREEIKDVPEGKLCDVVGDYVLAGKRKITLLKQNDGNWTIIAE